MITCLAIGATILAIPLFTLTVCCVFARDATFKWRGISQKPAQLWFLLLIVPPTSIICGLSVYLWQSALR